MTVLLRHSGDFPPASDYGAWFAVTGAQGKGPEDRKLPALARRLEDSFSVICPEWWELARTLANGVDVELSFAGMCAGYGSDFGLMMAWGHLVQELAAKSDRCLCLCDDPWLFRHLSALPGVEAGKAPSLLAASLRLKFRGFFARLRLIGRLAWTTRATRRQRNAHTQGDSVILVYGHPHSNVEGYDDYFGNLMQKIPGLKRALHTDCAASQAIELAADGRTASLHAWGNPWKLPGLLFRCWRPRQEHTKGPYGWLVLRALETESGGAGHAINAWQHHCQKVWLARVRPRVVVWPWENFGWERAFCRSALKFGASTIGYQHTVIGPQQLNYSPLANIGGADSLPARILCNGPAYRDQLISWGLPEDRLGIGGSLRLDTNQNDLYDPEGPVFMALSGILSVARQQLDAAEKIAASGRRVLIKDHPMYPLETEKIEQINGISKTTLPLKQQSGLSAVVYCTGTSGLDSLLAGLPTIRILLEDRVSLSVLPDWIAVPTATINEVASAVSSVQRPPPIDWAAVLSSPDMDIWRACLDPASEIQRETGKSNSIL